MVVAVIGIAAIAGIYFFPGEGGAHGTIENMQGAESGESGGGADSITGVVSEISGDGTGSITDAEAGDQEDGKTGVFESDVQGSGDGISDGTAGANGEDASAGAETVTDAETEQEDPQPEVVEITISAVGDLTFGRNQKQGYESSFDEYYDTYGADYFLQNVKEIFEADDCSIGNCEGTLTDSEDIRTPKEWNHKGRPEYADIFTDSSIEVVSLGNNHIMDYNEEGVSDTFSALENAGVTYAISGMWGDQYGLYETEKGIKIGFVSVNEYYEGTAVYTYLEDGLSSLREQGADLVFALMHWGGDKTHVIEDDQYTMGRWCIDQGYDLVLGCHPHVLQGIECYNGKYIVYSMGNFCYGGSRNPEDKDSMIFQQTFTFVDGVLQDDSQAIRAIPCRLSSTTSKNDYCPVVLTGDEAAEVIGHLNEYSEEFGIAFDVDGYLLDAEQ
jgi:poly-gamma-glutamate synthesis protein (capsule biosynthesis protein)